MNQRSSSGGPSVFDGRVPQAQDAARCDFKPEYIVNEALPAHHWGLTALDRQPLCDLTSRMVRTFMCGWRSHRRLFLWPQYHWMARADRLGSLANCKENTRQASCDCVAWTEESRPSTTSPRVRGTSHCQLPTTAGWLALCRSPRRRLCRWLPAVSACAPRPFAIHQSTGCRWNRDCI